MSARFRAAALAYFAYGVVYYVGGLWLVHQGIGVMGTFSGGGRRTLVFWALMGLVPLLAIPFFLWVRQRWFERWIVSRRDFARLVAFLLAFRALKVGEVAFHHDGAAVTAPWGGDITFQAGARVFLVVTVAALIVVARAAWAAENERGEA
jgi:hypothetical protein